MDKTLYYPAFENNNITIVLSTNDLYVPYVATVIQSIMDNGSEQNGYDFFILCRDIEAQNKDLLAMMASQWTNCSIRLIDMSPYVDKAKFFTGNRLTIETYFRMFMPEILVHYKKAIYLDADVTVRTDIAELYNENLDGYFLGATRDCWIVGLCHDPSKDRLKYSKRILKLKNPDNYLQAGVLLFNLEEFRKHLSSSLILQTAQAYEWRHHDQDVLNILCEDKIKFVDQSWDIVTAIPRLRVAEIISLAPPEIANSYFEGRKNPKIVHYAASEKPWNTPSVDFFQYFWEHARRTPYYEVILSRLMQGCNMNGVPHRDKKVNTQQGGVTGNVAVATFAQGNAGLKTLLSCFKAWLKYKMRK